MGNEISPQPTPPDAETSLYLLEATTFDALPLDDPRVLGVFLWIHYKSGKSPDVSILDEAIQATQNAIELELEQDDRAQLLFDLDVRLDARSELTCSLGDLERTISAYQSAVKFTPDGDPNQIVRLSRLGAALLERFERIGDVDPLNAATTAFCCAVELADTYPEKPSLLTNYGVSLLKRFDRLGELEDIECSIAILRCADELVSDEHPDKPEFSSNLGNSFLSRFSATGDLYDIEQAISRHRRAVELTPDSHPNKHLLFNNLGNSCIRRFERTGELEYLEQAISSHRRAVELTPDGHPNKHLLFNNLGSSFLARFKRTGELGDLGEAISSHRRAVELTLDGHPDKPSRLNNLGNSFLVRFERTGELKDLEQAITSHRSAVELTPDDHPDKPSWFSNLGNSFLTHFERTGELRDIEQAISTHDRAAELTPDNHPHKPLRFDNLGNSFLARFERTGGLEDLELGISSHRCAVELTSDGHPNKPLRLNNLGNSLVTGFERTGELEDLEGGISSHRCAVQLTPDGHPDKPGRLNNLGGALMRRFERTGELDDLEHTISTRRRSVELTPDGHSDMPLWLHNLGNSLSKSFERTGNREDLEQAISSYRRALDLTADDHPHKPSMLRHLCHKLRSRFERTQEPVDIQDAISAGDRAIALSPAGHRTLFGHYNALAGCFQRRFEHSGDIDDIGKAISLFQKATELISDGDPWLSSALKNLGGAQERLFERTQTQDDFDVVVESLTKATVYVYGRPSIRFDSARRCVDMLSDNPSFTTMESLLLAHSRVIAILPEIVWLGHGIHRRYEESSQLGEIVNVAVAAAITAGALKQAVEWLEAGRALIWAQVLALRTPLDELQDSHPELANPLRSVQQQLQSSAHSTFVGDIDAFGSVDGLTANPSADRHREAAIKYDKIMKEIRTCPGFEDFLRPKTFDSLIPAPEYMSGPVVFINVHSTRCDAIVLHVDGAITTTPLPELSLWRASLLQLLWSKGIEGSRYRVPGSQPHEPPEETECQLLELNPGFALPLHRHTSRVGDDGDLFVRVTQYMWTWIVEPILQSLDLASNDRLPHITWCPTGPLTQLPLHAAGIYGGSFGPRTFDFVVSSYTPSLSSFLRCIEGVANPHRTRSILVVTQPATPGLSQLPKTREEGVCLQGVIEGEDIKSGVYDHERATVESIRGVMDQYPWVHLACHGSQNKADATQSAFHLFDGPLTLSDLMGTVADHAELAFLSACQTAAGDEKTPEESAHLAAGMLAAGFKGVIATMWSIQDADAPIIVEAYYKELLVLRNSGTLGKGETGAAYALHEATRVLRDSEQVGETSFMRWVPFVHFGV